jgi:hypothetical protein
MTHAAWLRAGTSWKWALSGVWDLSNTGTDICGATVFGISAAGT